MRQESHTGEAVPDVEPTGSRPRSRVTLHGLLAKRVFYPINLWQKRIHPRDLREFCARDEWSREHLRECQRQGLRQLLIYAAAQCPYYRQSFERLGVRPAANDPFSELPKFPPMTKTDVRANLDQLFSNEFKARKGLIKKATGGSGGRPLVVWGDFEDYRQNGLVIARQRRWVGWEGGMKTLNIFGGFRDLQSVITRTAKRWLINETLVNNMARENGDYDRLAERLLKAPPEAIIAYFSSLRELARALEKKKRPLAGVKVVIACAEPLDERGRRHAEQWLGTPVYFQYGCRELGALGQECREQAGYHYPQDVCYCEVLDDRGEPADQGHLTITHLGNRVVPLIRYQIGDGASLDNSPCHCGLPHLRLKSIDGRISSMITTPGGQLLTSMIFPHVFKDYPWILEFQVEQTYVNRLEVRVKRDAPMFSETSRQELEAKVLGLLGRDMAISWRFDEPFVPVPTGKHVYFVSRL